jgi:NADH:ubiquinone oxidoreductase subunit 5 (subunit L)/multisubunit Na+/H+ antiporter MnhA subunit
VAVCVYHLFVCVLGALVSGRSVCEQFTNRSPTDKIELVSFLVVLAAVTNSAQVSFPSRLPTAVAAPTPVSAIHFSQTYYD